MNSYRDSRRGSPHLTSAASEQRVDLVPFLAGGLCLGGRLTGSWVNASQARERCHSVGLNNPPGAAKKTYSFFASFSLASAAALSASV